MRTLLTPHEGSAAPRRGFTLVELIVVITIIGILAGIATVTYLGTRDTVTSKEPQRAIRAIETAQQLQHRSRGKYLDGSADSARLERLDESFKYTGYASRATTIDELLTISVGVSPITQGDTAVTGTIEDGANPPGGSPALVIAAVSRTGQCYALVTFPEDLSPTRYPPARITYPVTGEGEVRGGETPGQCTAADAFARYPSAIAAGGERAQW